MQDFTLNIENEAKEFKGGFTVITPGWKKMLILTGQMKATATGGQQLVLTLQCDEGKFDDRLNIFNSSEIAQRIGRQALAKVCESAGLSGNFSLKDMPKLFGRYIDVEVSVEKFKSNKPDANGEFKELSSNKAKNYAKAGTNSGKPQSAHAEKEAATGTSGKPLW